MKFRAVLKASGKTATGIVVPPEVVEALGDGKRPAVRVTVRGHTYRSTIAVMGGDYMLPVSAENRKGAGIVAGDELEFISTAFDDGNGGPGIENLNTVTFTERDGVTEVTVHAVVVKAAPAFADALAGMNQGWNESLDRLVQLLETGAVVPGE